MTLSNPNYFLKAPSPNSTMLGVSAHTYGFTAEGVDTIQSVHRSSDFPSCKHEIKVSGLGNSTTFLELEKYVCNSLLWNIIVSSRGFLFA